MNPPTSDSTPVRSPGSPIRKQPPQKKSFFTQVAQLFRGQVLFAFSQWAILALLVRYGGELEAGRYFLAMATTAPIFLFFDLNLRVSRSTDHQYEEQFRSYLGLRFWCLILASIVSVAIAAFFVGKNPLVFAGIIAYRVGESISNLSFGGYQRMEFTDRIGKSLTYKGIIALVVMAIVIKLSGGNAGIAAIVMAVISLAWATLVDLPGSWTLNEPDYELSPSSVATSLADVSSASRIVQRSLPLGFDALISSLALNVPKYCIEYWFGSAALGVYGVLSQLAFSIQLLIGAVGHAGVPVLSSLYQKQDNRPFWRLLNRMLLTSLVVGLLAIIGGTLVVPLVMTQLLGPSFNETLLFFLLLVGASLAAVQRTAGRATQACGSYFTYTLFDIVIFSTTVIAALLLVKEHGVVGAAISIVIGFAVGLLVTLIHTYSFLPQEQKQNVAENERITTHT